MLTWSASANSSATHSTGLFALEHEVRAEERDVQALFLRLDGPVGEHHGDPGVTGFDEHGVPAGLDDGGEGDDVDALFDELADRLDLSLLLALGVREDQLDSGFFGSGLDRLCVGGSPTALGADLGEAHRVAAEVGDLDGRSRVRRGFRGAVVARCGAR